MRRWLINVAKNETILIVAAILALISCFIVPPDADYKSYIHASTISQLIWCADSSVSACSASSVRDCWRRSAPCADWSLRLSL
mgnify:CR=1 FL=1